MFVLTPLFKTTIGRKYLVGISGLALCGFVLVHMLGNLLLFVGPEAYNHYGHTLTSNPLLIVAELGLVLFFVLHAGVALVLQAYNWAARPKHYMKVAKGVKRTTLIQRTLWAQGIVIFIFTILHLVTFKYGKYYEAVYNGTTMRDLYRLVMEVFQSPYYTLWYVFAVSLLLFHLTHGLASSLQTLGFNHPRYGNLIKRTSWAYGILVGVGFICQPLYVFLFHQGQV